MKLSELLGAGFACDCGRTHRVPVRRLLYAAGAVDSLPEVLSDSPGGGPVRRVAVVADTRTWDIGGERTRDVLRQAGLQVARIIVPDRGDRLPVCDEAAFHALAEQLRSRQPDSVVAVGSGVINDLCKWASFELGVPYVVVATAASMNGYSAANVAPTVAGVKVLVEARPPGAVLAEPAVIEHAPYEMTAAGFGDTIAKHQSNADWIMNSLLFDEYYCHFCAGITGGLDHLYLDHPEDIRAGRSEAIGGLFEALFWTGLAMTLVGTSAPASGGEHLLSHTLDMVAGVRGESHDLHGRQVGVGTLVSAALYQRVLSIDRPTVGDLPASIDADFWQAPSVTAAVTEQYEAKRRRLGTATHRLTDPGAWDQLRSRLAAAVKGPETIRGWLVRAGGAVSVDDIGCSLARLRSALLHMHEIRRRFTIVDLAWLLGILPGAAEDIIDEWLVAGPG